MKVYLIFGECDGFGNDAYLSGIAENKKDAINIFWNETYFCNTKTRKYFSKQKTNTDKEIEKRFIHYISKKDILDEVEYNGGGIYCITDFNKK